MAELIYPEKIAPLVLGCESTRAAEMLPLVNESGLVIAQAPREYFHGGSKALHPVVHLHIVNREGNVYLQRRSATKKLLPLYWDTAVGGHISYGETVIEALFREASEELGLYDFQPYSLGSYVFESKVEHELVHIFAAVGDFDIHPDNDEVIDGRFWTPAQIKAATGKDTLTPNFESEYKKIKSQLEALL